MIRHTGDDMPIDRGIGPVEDSTNPSTAYQFLDSDDIRERAAGQISEIWSEEMARGMARKVLAEEHASEIRERDRIMAEVLDRFSRLHTEGSRILLENNVPFDFKYKKWRIAQEEWREDAYDDHFSSEYKRATYALLESGELRWFGEGIYGTLDHCKGNVVKWPDTRSPRFNQTGPWTQMNHLIVTGVDLDNQPYWKEWKHKFEEAIIKKIVDNSL